MSSLARSHRIIARREPQFARCVQTLLKLWFDALPDDLSTDQALATVERIVALEGAATLAWLERSLYGGALLERTWLEGAEAGLEMVERPVRLRVAPALQAILADQTVMERAADYARQNRARLIREVSGETRRAVQAIVERGLRAGWTIPQYLKNIRQAVGLTARQAQAVATFRAQLEQRSTLGGMSPQDRRLNPRDRALVIQQMSEGRLNQTQIDRLVERYHASLVQKRALDIARTETARAVEAGKQRGWEEAANRGLLNRQVAGRRWVSVMDGRERPAHREAHRHYADSPVRLDQPFVVGGVSVMSPPLGVNCRCGTELVVMAAAEAA